MDKLKSRKLWVTIISALLMVANQGIGLKLPEDTILSFAGVVMSYIFGQSIVDAKQPFVSAAPVKEKTSEVIQDQQEASVPVLDDKQEPVPVAPVQPVVDPNQEKLNKIAELQLQINQLQAEISQPVVNTNPSVVINQ